MIFAENLNNVEVSGFSLYGTFTADLFADEYIVEVFYNHPVLVDFMWY